MVAVHKRTERITAKGQWWGLTMRQQIKYELTKKYKIQNLYLELLILIYCPAIKKKLAVTQNYYSGDLMTQKRLHSTSFKKAKESHFTVPSEFANLNEVSLRFAHYLQA